MEVVNALNRIILALVLVLSFGMHEVMQCESATLSAASARCSHHHTSCPHRSTPASPVKGCCANLACLSYEQCTAVEGATVSETDVAQFQPASASISIFPLAAAELAARFALRFHPPPAEVPFFVTHHAFLI
jgi:hypothetical protein